MTILLLLLSTPLFACHIKADESLPTFLGVCRHRAFFLFCHTCPRLSSSLSLRFMLTVIHSCRCYLPTADVRSHQHHPQRQRHYHHRPGRPHSCLHGSGKGQNSATTTTVSSVAHSQTPASRKSDNISYEKYDTLRHTHVTKTHHHRPLFLPGRHCSTNPATAETPPTTSPLSKA